MNNAFRELLLWGHLIGHTMEKRARQVCISGADWWYDVGSAPICGPSVVDGISDATKYITSRHEQSLLPGKFPSVNHTFLKLLHQVIISDVWHAKLLGTS